MPVYFCYHGDCSHLANQPSGRSLLVAQDAFGHDWLCVETGLREIPGGLPESVTEMIGVQGLTHMQGFGAEGTGQIQLDCPDEASLRRQLILSTYPEAAESRIRLAEAGWTDCQLTWGTGEPHKLSLTNGREAITVEGASVNEAWHRAVQWVLGPRPEMKGGMPIMTLTIKLAPVPLRTDEYGAIRVGDSQVLLDVVVREFKQGASPEVIAKDYSTLEPADVYAVIAYYLRNQEEVDQYLQDRRDQAEKLREEIEAKQPAELRAKLLARKAEKEQGHHASPAQ